MKRIVCRLQKRDHVSVSLEKVCKVIRCLVQTCNTLVGGDVNEINMLYFSDDVTNDVTVIQFNDDTEALLRVQRDKIVDNITKI